MTETGEQEKCSENKVGKVRKDVPNGVGSTVCDNIVDSKLYL